MGRIILKNNGKTTILTSGEDLGTLTPTLSGLTIQMVCIKN